MNSAQAQPLFDHEVDVQRPQWDAGATCVPLHAAIPEIDASGRKAPATPAIKPSPSESIAKIEQAFRQKLEAAQRSLEDERSRYARAAQALENAQARFVRDAEEQTIALALHIARTAIGHDAQVRADFVHRMAHEALASMRESQRITLRVAPADAEALRRALRVDNPAQHCEVVEDPTLQDGGLIAMGDGVRFDADVKGRLRAIEQQLSDATRGAHHV